MGEILTRSRSASSASFCASREDITPSCAPSSATTLTSGSLICSLMSGSFAIGFPSYRRNSCLLLRFALWAELRLSHGCSSSPSNPLRQGALFSVLLLILRSRATSPVWTFSCFTYLRFPLLRSCSWKPSSFFPVGLIPQISVCFPPNEKAGSIHYPQNTNKYVICSLFDHTHLCGQVRSGQLLLCFNFLNISHRPCRVKQFFAV